MFSQRNTLIFVIFVIVQESSIAEWVELPQFSDEKKVYRMPFNKHDLGIKLFHDNRDGTRNYEYTNATTENENFHRRFGQQYAAIDKTTTESIVSTIADVYSSNIEIIVTESPPSNEDHTEDTFVMDEEEEKVTLPIIHDADETIVIDSDQLYQPDETQQEIPKPEVNEENDNEKTSFFAYIPLELFKRVHAILRSQSTTVEGKIEFLRRFETSLLAEIEQRLVPVINPVRKKRESRGDHGWDDHDESVGFPSLEGALLAIAFLTFAVYLVQLVMMLFRNLGNNPNTGTATVLFNRNKRSVDEFTEDTARILDYLDKFVKYQYENN